MRERDCIKAERNGVTNSRDLRRVLCKATPVIADGRA